MSYYQASGSLVWQEKAACREEDVNKFFPEQGHNADVGKKVCIKCPVRLKCYGYSIRNREQWGTWGGVTQDVRRKLLSNGSSVEAFKKAYEEGGKL